MVNKGVVNYNLFQDARWYLGGISHITTSQERKNVFLEELPPGT